MDDLVARIQLGNDEMHGGAVSQHAMFVRIFVGRGAGKRRQEAVVQIEDASARKLPADRRGAESACTGQHDVIDLVAIEEVHQPIVIGARVRVADLVPFDAELLRQAPARIAVADHDGGSCRMCPLAIACSTARAGSGR